MSQELVEIIERGFAHYAATGEQVWDLYSDDVVVRDHESPDQAEYLGHNGMRRWIGDWSGAWDEWRIEVEEILDAGDAVLALVHHTALGHASGMKMDSHDGMLFTFRDGKVVALDYYTGRERALAAAGLAG
ncbi:MAG TPA: nuclear transport factor 2 family protein [Thermoleophilaceae bacterium]